MKRRQDLLCKWLSLGVQAGLLTGSASAFGAVGFLGVAAGDVSSTDAIIWTALNPRPTDSVSLIAEISEDPNFGNFMSQPVNATAATDYTAKVHVTVSPGKKYYYRFVGPAQETSIVGTFKSAPLPNVAAPVKFAFSGDCDGFMRPYPLTHDFDKLGLDFFAFLGDTIYETPSLGSAAAASTGNIPAPSSSGASPATMKADYSRKYREQFLPVNSGGQNGLQTFFAAQGNYTLFDNHELGNKQYINGGAPAGGPVDGMSSGAGVDARVSGNDVNTTGTFMNKTPGFTTLEDTYLDYQPVNELRAGPSGFLSTPSDPNTDNTPQLFFAQQWGKNAVYIHTDTRSYRDIRMKTAANADETSAPRANNPDRTMFGKTQFAWLKQTLLAAEAAHTSWKFVSISDPIDQIGPIGGSLAGVTGDVLGTMTPFSGNASYGPVNSDGGKSFMGGYRAERNALLKFIADNHIRNVVFLATDDHQNRINELTYSKTDTETQSTYERVPSCFTIVDGPLGATGPDLFVNHDFASLRGAANLIADAQAAAHIDPIGLDANYPGLHNLYREGDLQADTLRQPIDFYSPDTFNYTTLEVGADCPTLTVTTWGINSYAKDSRPEASATGAPRKILSFQIDGDIEPPSIQSVTPSQAVLSPPNHKMVPVTLRVSATDNCTIVSSKIVNVTSSEAANSTGDGNTSVDWSVTGDLALNLRAERSGSGSGRIYTITVEVTDQAGNKSQASTTVTVPK